MKFSQTFSAAALLAAFASAQENGAIEERAVAASAASKACASIAKAISNQSAVYYAPNVEYYADLHHYFTSSEQNSACSVEVGTASDAAAVMKIVGSTRTPFAIKSGGHASNPGFSSTLGVQISLARFKQVTLSKDKTTVTVGLGNTWTQVYTALNGTGYNVVGGRVDGPGTGGFSLGGGYSWLTNQYGLTCDTIKSYTLILPNGTITTVDSTQPDLFFALKGGLNRFGLVTEIVYKAVPQPNLVYAGLQVFAKQYTDALINATNYFDAHNTDKKAQVILTIDSTSATNSENILLSFYDGNHRPAAFAPFHNIPALVSTLKVQTFASFGSSTPASLSAGKRGVYNSISTTHFTLRFLEACKNESYHYASLDPLDLGLFISYDIEPFSSQYGKLATDSAFPHANSPRPLNIYFGWTNAAKDAFWRSKIVESAAYLTQIAKEEGIYSSDLAVYPNYAVASTDVNALYGAKNVARLRAIKARVDPKGVMELAGGFAL